jgi:hypothetical protein
VECSNLPAGMVELGGISSLASLETIERFTDTELRQLSSLTQLKSLDVSGCPVKDFAALAGLTQLQSLHVGSFSDFGRSKDVVDLAVLTMLTSLTALRMGCLVENVASLTCFKHLEVRGGARGA